MVAPLMETELEKSVRTGLSGVSLPLLVDGDIANYVDALMVERTFW